jgi:hypothetical protein
MTGMGWLVAGGIVAVALALVVIDRIVARGSWDRRRPRARRPAEHMTASGVLGDLIEVFQPNQVHLTAEQERRRTQITQREDGQLDLDSGVVHLDPPR